jgi:hypothetical protein
MSGPVPHPPRCQHCDDVIGVYEPMVFVDEGGARVTSGAAEPGLGAAPGARFHRSCFAAWSAEADDAG